MIFENMTFLELQTKYEEAFFRIKKLERENLHTAIIDKRLIWYGSVNILGYPAFSYLLLKIG